MPGEGAYGAHQEPSAQMAAHAPIESGPEGELVWRHLKAAWMTHRMVSDTDTHVKGGYSWDASRYLPVMTLDTQGDIGLGFARKASE